MKPRVWFYVLVVAFLIALVVAVRVGAGEPMTDVPSGPDPPPGPAAPTATGTVIVVDSTLQGRTAKQWHAIAARYLSRKRSLERALRFDPQTVGAINLACVVYGNCDSLWRKAKCESHLWRYARNPSSGASGLFQFLPSTWRSTPYGRFSIYDPYANALAAGWMHTHGRGGEWSCR